MTKLNHRGCEYHLRTMALSDLPALLEIEQQSHAHPWSENNFISSITSTHHCQLILDQELIVAYIITSTAADEAELLNITVAPQYRRRGLASMLLELTANSFDDSIHTLFLEVRESNQAAIALYDELGFNAVGQRPNYYPASSTHNASSNKGREDAIIMAKALGF